MNARVEVRPGDRLEALCVAAAMRTAGVDAVAERPAIGVERPADLVVQLVWTADLQPQAFDHHDDAGDCPVLYCVMGDDSPQASDDASVISGTASTDRLVAGVTAMLAGSTARSPHPTRAKD